MGTQSERSSNPNLKSEELFDERTLTSPSPRTSTSPSPRTSTRTASPNSSTTFYANVSNTPMKKKFKPAKMNLTCIYKKTCGFVADSQSSFIEHLEVEHFCKKVYKISK